MKLFLICIAALLAQSANALTCNTIKDSVTGYSTSDGFFHLATTYIVDFGLQCDAPLTDTQLYAVVDGRVYQVGESEDTSRLQLSWQLPHEQSSYQTFTANLYDQDTFAAYQRAINNEESTDSIKPLTTVVYTHIGVSSTRVFYPETYLTIAGLGLVYYAVNLRGQYKR